MEIVSLATPPLNAARRLVELRGVSKSWGSAINSVGHLWSNITLDIEDGVVVNEKEFNIALVGSRDAELTLSLHDNSWDIHTPETSLTRCVSAAALRTVRMVVDHFDTLSVLATVDWPVLKRLRVHHGDARVNPLSWGFEEVWTLLKPRTPMLDLLSVWEGNGRGRVSVTTMADFPSGALQRYCFRCHDDELRGVLQRLHGLRSVMVFVVPFSPLHYTMTSIPFNAPCTTTSITHLTLVVREPFGDILRNISFPQLESLKLLLLDFRQDPRPFYPDQFPRLFRVSIGWATECRSLRWAGVFPVLQCLPPMVSLRLAPVLRPYVFEASLRKRPRVFDSPLPSWARACSNTGECLGSSLCNHFLDALAEHIPPSVSNLDLDEACFSADALEAFTSRCRGLLSVGVRRHVAVEALEYPFAGGVAEEDGMFCEVA